MEGPEYEDDWTRVAYRRGRMRRREVTGDRPGRNRSYYPRRSYASVTRGYRQPARLYPTRASGNYRTNSWNNPRTFAPYPARTRFRSRSNGFRRERRNKMAAAPFGRWAQRGPGLNSRMGNVPVQNLVQSDDTYFTHKVRIIHKIIKAAHHLKNVMGPDPPPIIGKTTKELADFIKPASPTKSTLGLLEGNAKNWEYTTLLILQQHYEESMNNDILDLAEFPTLDWEGPYQIACNWARRNLGRRLKLETIQQVKVFLKESLKSQDDDDIPDVPQRQETIPPLRTTRSTTTQTPEHEPQTSPVPPASSPVAGPPRTTGTSPSRVTQWPEDGEPLSTSPRQQGPPPLFFSYFPSLSPAIPSLQVTTGEPKPQRQQNTRRRDLIEVTIEETSSRAAPLPTEEEAQTFPADPASPTTHNPCVFRDVLSIEADPGSTRSTQRGHPEPPLPSSTPVRLQSPTDLSSSSPQPSHEADKDIVGTEGVTSQLVGEPFGNIFLNTTQDKTSTSTRRPTRHLNTNNKHKEWSLCVRKKNLIIGDSNLSRFPPFQSQDLQIDSYPGATFNHAETLLRKATITTQVETVILSFGLNNRKQNTRATTIKQLQGALRAARNSFPGATILVPVINFSSALPKQDQLNMQVLNNYIIKNCDFIPQLPNKYFATELDQVHWTHGTATKMSDHWLKQLN